MSGHRVDRLGRGLLLATGLVVAATVVTAIVVMGSPGTQRQARLDERRVQDLQHLASAVEAHVVAHGALPPDLADVTARPGTDFATADPLTGAPYRYVLDGPRDYRLCARFDTDTGRGRAGTRPYGGDAWAHPAGEHCFERRWPRASPPRG